MDYKEVGETASKLLVYAKDMGLPEEIRGEMHAAAIMLFGVEEALRAAEAAEARAEKAERERDAAIDDLKEVADCEYCSGKCSNLETEDCRDCSDIGCQCRTCAGCSNWAWRGRPC